MKRYIRGFRAKAVASVLLGSAVGAGLCAQTATAETAQRGGTLDFVVAGEAPSKDGHRETTYAIVHPYAPFYSLLIRVNPDNPQSSDFVCDLCVGGVPEPTNGGKTFTFRIKEGVKFHDGTPLTARDVKATYDRIVFPPEGVPSARKAFFNMVDSVEAPDDTTVVFNLKFPSGAFLPALATPFNWIYSKKDLDEHGYDWHRDNVNGSGPFKFVQHQPGAFVEGVRNDDYHHEGQPYLDGFKAIIAKKMSVRIQAIRGNRPRSSSGASPRRRATIWSTRWATSSGCRRATGTACCCSPRTTRASPSTTRGCAAPSPSRWTAGAARSTSRGSRS